MQAADLLGVPANVSEIATRMQEYVLARENGKTQWEALEDAGQLTAPFHHQGRLMSNTFGRGFIRSLPFLNASIQGLSQYMRTNKTSFGRKRIRNVYLSATALIVATMALAISMADDETKQALFDMEPSQFGQYLFLPK